tara:strand:+ start:1170 stop:1508 length:339 start_codon:yes stop_codon:yes gene_type:complete
MKYKPTEREEINFKVKNFVGKKIKYDDGDERYIEEAGLRIMVKDEENNDVPEDMLCAVPAKLHLDSCPNGNDVGEDYLLVFDTFTFHPCHACNQFHTWPNLKNDVNLREEYL